MPQIGWFELLVIVVIAILGYWTKRFSNCFKKNRWTWTRTIKKYFSDVQSNISEITNIEDNKSSRPKKEKNIDKNNENKK